jgi:hypothetical protein
MLPRYGQRVVTEDGMQCHICGGFFRGVGSHAFYAHGMSAQDYRAEFGLGPAGLCGASTSEKCRDNALRLGNGEKLAPYRYKRGHNPNPLPVSEEGRLARKRTARARGAMNGTRSVCRNGHAFSPSNVRVDARGFRVCLTCYGARKRRAKRDAA